MLPSTETVSRPVTDANVVNVLGVITPSKIMIETIYDPINNKAQLVVKNSTDPAYKTNEYKTGNTVYRPIADEAVRYGHVILPTGYTCEINRQQLLEDIQGFIHKNVQLEKGFENITARYVMMSWLHDIFQKVPYLRIMGPWGTGKSRFLDTMAAVCYHSSKVGEGITSAGIFRWLSNYPGTLILDEMDLQDAEYQGTIVKVLNGGYDRNGMVVRCDQGRDGFKLKVFKTFGPKIVASHKPFEDDSLESRFLTQMSQEITRDDIQLTYPPFREWTEAIDLSNRLLGFRSEYYTKIDTNRRVKGLECFSSRLREIITPLLLITDEDEVPTDIKLFLEEQQDNHQADMAFGDDALVARAVIELYNEGVQSPFVQQVTERANSLRPNQQRLSAKKVGGILKSIGLQAVKQRNGYVVSANPMKLQTIAKRYGLSFPTNTE